MQAAASLGRFRLRLTAIPRGRAVRQVAIEAEMDGGRAREVRAGNGDGRAARAGGHS